MGYEIVGAVYDENGRPMSLDQLRREMLREVQSGSFSFGAGLLAPRGGAGMNLIPNFGAGSAAARMGSQLRDSGALAGTPFDPALRQTSPGPVDETPLPIDSGATIAAGASQVIATTSQIIFEPRRLIIPSSLAPFFVVDSISVGNVPLFAGAGAIPAEAFAPDSVNPNVRKITANPGVQIIVTVTNIDAVAHRFRGAFFGLGAQPEGCRT